MMSTFLVLLLLASVFAIKLVDAHCCLPKQVEGDMGSMVGENVGSHTELVQAGSRWAIDAVNKLQAYNTSLMNGELKEHIQSLRDYNKHISYTVLNGHCYKSKLPGDFPSFCLPDTAKKIYESYFGAGKDTLNVVTYQVKENDTTVTITVTKSCIPVSYTSHGQKGNVKFLEVDGFAGIELGIKDRAVFDIPAACKKQSIFKEFPEVAGQIMKRKTFLGF